MEASKAQLGHRQVASGASPHISPRLADLTRLCVEHNSLATELARFVPQEIKPAEPPRPTSTIWGAALRLFGFAEERKVPPAPVRYTEFSSEKLNRIEDLASEIRQRDLGAAVSRATPEDLKRSGWRSVSDIVASFVQGRTPASDVVRQVDAVGLLKNLARLSSGITVSSNPALAEVRTVAETLRESARVGKIQCAFCTVESALHRYGAGCPTGSLRQVEFWKEVPAGKIVELVNGLEAWLTRERQTAAGIQDAAGVIASNRVLSNEARAVFFESVLTRCGLSNLPVEVLATHGALSSGGISGSLENFLARSELGWPRDIAQGDISRALERALQSAELPGFSPMSYFQRVAKRAAELVPLEVGHSSKEMPRPIDRALEQFKNGEGAKKLLSSAIERVRGGFGWLDSPIPPPDNLPPVALALASRDSTIAAVRSLPAARALWQIEYERQLPLVSGYQEQRERELSRRVREADLIRLHFEETAALVVLCAADLAAEHPITRRLETLAGANQLSNEERKQILDYLGAGQGWPSFDVGKLSRAERQVVREALSAGWDRGIPLCAQDVDGKLRALSAYTVMRLIERAVSSDV